MAKQSQKEMFSRNIGLISELEQKKLRDSTVAIAGVGADGGLLAERLVRIGIGNLKLADPDTFDVSNLNRQFGSYATTLGHNKAETIAKIATEINPEINITTYLGVNQSNVTEFVSDADIVVDEIDYTRLDISVMLHKAARQQNKYVFLAVNIGWGANLFIFSPDKMTLEEYVGLPQDATTEDTRKFIIPPEKFAPQIPKYMDNELIHQIVHGKIPIPSVSPSVALEAGMISTAIVLYLTKNVIRRIVPMFQGIDLASYKAVL